MVNLTEKNGTEKVDFVELESISESGFKALKLDRLSPFSLRSIKAGVCKNRGFDQLKTCLQVRFNFLSQVLADEILYFIEARQPHGLTSIRDTSPFIQLMFRNIYVL